MLAKKTLYPHNIAAEVKKILNTSYNCEIHHITGAPYVVGFHLNTNKDLQMLSQKKKDEIKQVYLNYLNRNRKHFAPQMFEKSEVEFFFDSVENSKIVATQIKQDLEKRCGHSIFKIDEAYLYANVYGEPLKHCVTCIFFKTNSELHSLQLDEIKQIYIEILKEKKLIPERIDESNVEVFFDTDENVQKNYNGNYFYAMR